MKYFWTKLFYSIGIRLEDSIGKHNLTFRGNELQEPIYQKYKEYKGNYKLYYGFKDNDLLDRHKIASLITFAILNNKGFRYSFKFKTSQEEVLKKSLSFPINCSLSVLLQMILESGDLKEDQKDKLRATRRYKFPVLIQEKGKSYYDILRRDLYLYHYQNRNNQIDESQTIHYIRIFSYIFYHIESHNRSEILN